MPITVWTERIQPEENDMTLCHRCREAFVQCKCSAASAQKR